VAMMITLNHFFKKGGNVTETSKQSYAEVTTSNQKQAQVGMVENLLKNFSDGLCDFEIQYLLRSQFVKIPLSSVAARRNDVNKKYMEVYNAHVVIHRDGDYRKNPDTNKSCRVWRWCM